jgi:hypothetical protein
VPTTTSEAASRVAVVLGDLLGSPEETHVRLTDRLTREPHSGIDFEIEHSRWHFLAGWKGLASTVAVLKGARDLGRVQRATTSIPLVVVPFMGDAGKRVCADAGVSWIDLSGNADIRGPGLRLVVDGKPNRWVRRGRPADVFAPRSSGVARYLLMHPGSAHTNREIARGTGLDEGFVSRIVEKHIQHGFVVRDSSAALRLAEPSALLDAWRDSYDFRRHRVIEGFTIARSGEALMSQLAARLKRAGIGYAATGLSAAWLYTQFASFRLVTFFVDRPLTDADMKSLEVRDEPRGANTWLVFPNDTSVFQAATKRDDVRCAHPLQVYLDLKAHPERADEAATELRGQLLSSALHGT